MVAKTDLSPQGVVQTLEGDLEEIDVASETRLLRPRS